MVMMMVMMMMMMTRCSCVRVFTNEAASRLVNSEEVNPETRPQNRMTGVPKLICRAQVPLEWDLHYLVTKSSKKKSQLNVE